MAKTLANLRTHCRQYLDEVSEADWSDVQINGEINYAYLEAYTAVIETYEDYYKTDYTANLVEDQQAYALPSDFLKMRRLEVKYDSDGNYVKATPYNFDQIGVAYDSTTFSSLMRPIYELSGSYIKLLPLPSENVTSGLRMIYIAQETDLDSDTDTINIPFPDRYGKYIVKGACAELLRKGQQEETVANLYSQEFQVGLEKMKQELEVRYADGSKMIQDTAGGYNDFGNISVVTGIT